MLKANIFFINMGFFYLIKVKSGFKTKIYGFMNFPDEGKFCHSSSLLDNIYGMVWKFLDILIRK